MTVNLLTFSFSFLFLNIRCIDLIITLQFTAGDLIELINEQELLLTRTQDVDFKKFGETLPRKINNVR